jgi:serine/threonine-protein kinase
MGGVLRAGAVVDGRFTAQKLLGGGSFGEVWLAIDSSSGAEVALKILRPELREDRAVRERFQREAELLAALDHPAITRAVAWSLHAELPYLAIEYVPGVTLRRLIQYQADKSEPFPLEELSTMISSIASAIDHAHAKKVIHRDLKPKNIMCLGEGDRLTAIKVLDFGIAKVLEGDASSATTQGRLLGSVGYMSPEQIEGTAIDATSDIFALSVILFELLTLRKPWTLDADGRPALTTDLAAHREASNSHLAVMDRILRGERPRPSAFRDLPPEVDQVLRTGLAIDRRARFTSAGALAAALAASLPERRSEGFGPEASRTLPLAALRAEGEPPEPPSSSLSDLEISVRRERDSPWRWAFGGAALAAITLLGVFISSREPPAPAVIVTPTVVGRAVPAPAPPVEAKIETRDPAPPPILTKKPAPIAPARRVSPPPTPPPPAKSPPAPLHPELRAMLAELEEHPEDGALRGRLSDAMRAASTELKDPSEKKEIDRCMTASAVMSDVHALARCLDRLLSGLRR